MNIRDTPLGFFCANAIQILTNNHWPILDICHLLTYLNQATCISTSVIHYEELLSVSCHADHSSWQAEDLLLHTTDGEQPDHQSTGGHCRPALTQTQGTHVLAFRKIHHPVLMSVPAREVQTLDLTVETFEKIFYDVTCYSIQFFLHVNIFVFMFKEFDEGV